MMNKEMRMRKIPFAKPERVSIREYPYVNRSFGFHVAITEAKRPIAMAMQSNAIWIASEIRPKLFVQTPYSIWTSMYAKLTKRK